MPPHHEHISTEDIADYAAQEPPPSRGRGQRESQPTPRIHEHRNQVARSGQRRITRATQKSHPPTSSPTNNMPLEAVPPLPSVHPSPQHHWGHTSSYRVPLTENDFFESEDAPIQWPDGPLGSPHNGHPPTRSTTIGYQFTDAGPTYSFPGPLQTPSAGSAIPSAPNSTAVAVNVATDEIVSVPARVEESDGNEASLHADQALLEGVIPRGTHMIASTPVRLPVNRRTRVAISLTQMKTTAPAVTSAPSLSTPQAQEPRSVDRSGDSETSSSDIEANAPKRKKTKRKDRSARALEFQRKEVIGRAYIHYKLRIMTQEPWTRLDIQAVEAWGDACDDLGVGFDLAPRAQEQELIRQRAPQVRGAAKTIARELVPRQYGFKDGQSEEVKAYNRNLVAKLLKRTRTSAQHSAATPFSLPF